jgi:hypothetical protein
MANPVGALPALPPALGSDSAARDEYFAALNKTLQALETRAASPINLFNVAGQFFNPGRTGSFGEALGNVATSVGRDVERGQELAIPVAQMRAQIAGQKYTTEKDAEALRILADNLGVSTSDLSNPSKASGLTTDKINRMIQLYPIIESKSPTVGKMVSNLIDMNIKATDIGIKEKEFGAKFDPEFNLKPTTTAPATSTSEVKAVSPSMTSGSVTPGSDVYRFENLSDAQKQRLKDAYEGMALRGDLLNRPDVAELFNKMPIEKRRDAFIRSGESKEPATTVTKSVEPQVSPRRPGETLEAYNNRIKAESQADIDVYKKSQEAREATPQKKFDLIATYDRETVNTTNAKLDNLYKMVNTDQGKRVMSLMNKQGVLTAIAQGAESGITTPIGSLSAPALEMLQKLKLKPEDQNYARLIAQTISDLNMGVMKQGKDIFGPQISVYDAQKMAEPGFKTTDSSEVVSALVNKFKIMNHFQGEINKAQQDFFERNPKAKTSQFFKSQEFFEIADQYTKTLKRLNELSPL